MRLHSLLPTLLTLALVACQPSAEPPAPQPPATPAPTPAPVTPAAVVRVELTPEAALLRSAGEEVALTVRAYDAEGRVLERPVTWHSTHADVVGVEGGRARALAALGSSRLVAEVDGVRSNAALVLVAQTRPDVTLVTDAQVRSAPVALPPLTEDPAEAPRFEAVLQDVPTPVPGQLLVSQGSTPLLGRVLSAEADGTGVRVRMVVPALPEVFEQLRLDEQLELESSGDTATPADLAQGLPTPGIPDYEFMLGPLKCKTTPEVVLIDSPLSFKNEVKLVFDTKLDVRDGDVQHLRLVAKGRAVVVPVGGLTLQLKGKLALSCEKELHVQKVRLPGFIALAFTPAVPFGLGFSLEGAATLDTYQLILEGRLVRDFTTGLDFTPATGPVLVREVNDTAKITPRLIATPAEGAKDDDLEVSAHLVAYTGVNALVGAELKKFGLLKLATGPKLELKWEPELNQAERLDYAAVLDLKWQTKWGLAGDTKDFLTLIRGVTGPYVGYEEKVDLVIARTPAGALLADRLRLQEDEPVRLTVRYTPDTTRFLGAYTVEQVLLYRLRKVADGTHVLEQVPGLAPLTPSGEQTEFTWEWTPRRGDLGQHTFVAFTKTVLPVFTFEVTESSRVTLVVDQRCDTGVGFPMCVESGPSVSESGAVRVTPTGTIAGYLNEGDRMRAVTWNWSLGHTALGLLSTGTYAQSAALGLSPSGGLVTGWADSRDTPTGHDIPEAFLWRNGQMVGLGTRAFYGPASQSEGHGVLDDGTVAGQVLRYQNGTWEAFAWAWKDGVLTDLGGIGASSSLGTGTVSGFDSAGRIVGNRVIALFPGSTTHLSEPTVWTRGTNGAWTQRALPHMGMGAVLSGGNGRGAWVGSVMTSQTQHRAVRWTESGYSTLGHLGGSSHAAAANTRGDVVGYSFTDDTKTQRRAMLVRADRSVVDLNTLVNPQLGWVLETATDINDEGVIVGQGRQNGQLRMFRLVPRPAS